MDLKRLTIELPETDHAFIKMEAARLGVSIKVYVIQALALYASKTQERD